MVLVTCNRALAQGDFCLLALIFCQTHCVVCWIYNHAQYLYKRREMMQWWVGWLDEKVGYSTWTTIGIAQSLAIQCKVLCASVCPTNIYSAQETQLKQWMQSYLLESQTHCIVIMNKSWVVRVGGSTGHPNLFAEFIFWKHLLWKSPQPNSPGFFE